MRKLFFLSKFILLIGIGVSMFIVGCRKEEFNNKIIKNKIIGYIQKGPFVNGTTIDIFELNGTLGQTGDNFRTTITNNTGGFEINNVELTTQYVELSAIGFYYNEVSGNITPSQLVLGAISDVLDISTVNVNIITHLEKDRTKYLVGQGLAFSEAKKQSQQEIFSMFGFSNEGVRASELLSISADTEGDDILLAISVILQGNRSVGELTELLSNIISDIKEDGVLNNKAIKSILYNSAANLNSDKIRKNLEKRYEELGIPYTISGFESKVQSFLLSEQPFKINADITNVKCHGGNSGAINITVNEGEAPFSFLWSNNESTEDVSNLSAGNYSVTIIDANGFEMRKSGIQVNEPTEIMISEVVEKPICEGKNGGIDISISGGTLPYSYNWSDGSILEDLHNVSAGIYTLAVTDSNSCIKENEFIVEAESSDLSILIDITNATNNTSPDGAIDITVSGGTAPYSFIWSNGCSEEDNSNLPSGFYTVSITDANNCSFISDYIIVSYNEFDKSSVTDIDGNTYGIVQIGDQFWMDENLKATKLTNGTSITNKTWDWYGITTPLYCIKEEKYGALYNWYTVETELLCPIGWHVPTVEDYLALTNFLGGESVTGLKLKEAGTTNWTEPNLNTTNEFGFTALPGGVMLHLDSWLWYGVNGFWWLSTEVDSEKAQFLGLNSNKDNSTNSSQSKQDGMSVRCMRY